MASGVSPDRLRLSSVRLQKPVKSKITRFAPFSSVAQAGYVNVVEAEWNKELFDELEVFGAETKHKDDMADCISDCFTILNKTTEIPDFTLDSGVQSGPIYTGFNNQQIIQSSFESMPSFNFTT